MAIIGKGRAKTAWRVAIPAVFAITVCLILLPVLLQSRAERAALLSAHRIFDAGDVRTISRSEADGLISKPAADVLVNNLSASGKFVLAAARVEACQISGAPCVVLVTITQGSRRRIFRLYVYWGIVDFTTAL